MQDNSRDQLIDRIVELVESLNLHVHGGPKAHWRGSRMTIPQIKALAALNEAGSMRMGEIATSLGSTLSATSTIVDRLVNKGHVERGPDPSDRRVVVCQLTAQGRETLLAFWRIDRTRLVDLAERRDGQQLQAVVQGLELLRGTVDDSP